MKGRLIVYSKGKSLLLKLVDVYEALEHFSAAKELYRDYTAVHYLDGSIKGEAKNGFTLSDIEIEFTPLKKDEFYTKWDYTSIK